MSDNEKDWDLAEEPSLSKIKRQDSRSSESGLVMANRTHENNSNSTSHPNSRTDLNQIQPVLNGGPEMRQFTRLPPLRRGITGDEPQEDMVEDSRIFEDQEGDLEFSSTSKVSKNRSSNAVSPVPSSQMTGRTSHTPGKPLTNREKEEIPSVMKKMSEILHAFSVSRDNELKKDALRLGRFLEEAMIRDFEYMDRLETEHIALYSGLMRYKLREVNQQNEIIQTKYINEHFDLINFCFILIKRDSTALGFEDEKLFMMIQILKVILTCFEFGLFPIDKTREFLQLFFLKTEFINKQEEYISKNHDNFGVAVFEKLMECKSLCARILLQIAVLTCDDWLFYHVHQNEIDELVQDVKKEFSIKDILEIFRTKAVIKAPVLKEHAVMISDPQYSSLFSFIMFNYLLKELSKGDKIFSDPGYLSSMHNLILFVYDYKEDPFILSTERLIKPEYLPYYFVDSVDEDHHRRALEIIKLIADLRIKFREGSVTEKSGEKSSRPQTSPIDSGERLEQDIGNVFGMLEILMGLQDETYNIRLMLTEMKVPELLIDIFASMQECYIGDSGDEMFIQGLKVLFQLTKGNYPGQAQITKGNGWKSLKKLIKGNFSVFSILFLKQLFEDDPQYLHINEEFGKEVISLFETSFAEFFKTFSRANPIKNAKDLVSLYTFKTLVNLFIKTNDVDYKIIRAYYLPISKIVCPMVINFAYPIFMQNYLEMDLIYEPKLVTKNWKLEDGSFLVSLMMLSGDHIKCMLVDFAYSLIRLFNKSCEGYFPSKFLDGMKQILPLDMKQFDYLLKFSEGIRFKTEIMSSYTTFRVFGQASKIPEVYHMSELSLEGYDTNVDYLPDHYMKELPEMFVKELTKFEAIHSVRNRFEKEDLIDYFLRGLCQMIFKYTSGTLYFFLSIEKEEHKASLSRLLETMNSKIKTVMKVVMDEREMYSKNGNFPQSKLMRKMYSEASAPQGCEKIVEYLTNMTEMIERMFAGTVHEPLLRKYDLKLNNIGLKDLKIAGKMLRCEASYLSMVKDLKKDSQDKGDDADESKMTPEQICMRTLLFNYKRVKKTFLKESSKNKFYEVLQSKMENTNQMNLISYVCLKFESLDFDVSSFNSLWFDKDVLNTVIFLNNTMFWSSKTRIKLFEYTSKYPQRRNKLISIIYKALRDSFTMLVYSPFYNHRWEYIFSRFFIFSSFLRNLCRENCQEFKLFLGQYRPNLHCSNHSSLSHTVLTDIYALLMKFLNFSGISFNKSPVEHPSDRLASVCVIGFLTRCLVDLLTGPCRENQLRVYNIGNIVWLNLFSRVVDDLDSEYYSLMSLVLDYLLSLIEGNSVEIVKTFATTFDVPVLYAVMTKLMTYLWRRVILKRKKAETIRRRLKLKFKENNLQGSKNSLKSSASQDLNKFFDKSADFLAMEKEKINNWTDLISMYMNGDFENHTALNCSVRIFIFLSRVAYRSKKYQIFFDLKEKQLNEQFAAAGFKQEDIRLNKGRLKGETKAMEDLIVYYFMKSITSRIELKDPNRNSEIFIFPKRPMCFFLRETTRNKFVETCQIENTEAKLLDMFESFEQFFLEMKSHQAFKSKYRVIGKFATDKSFKYMRIFCYLISIAINIILLYDVKFDQSVITDTSKYPVLFSSITLSLISIVSIGIWLMSNYNVAWIESYRKFKVKHPYRNPYQPVNLVMILSDVFLRKDVINFFIHFCLAMLGMTYTHLVQVVLVLLSAFIWL